jgi:hypothetical protein
MTKEKFIYLHLSADGTLYIPDVEGAIGLIEGYVEFVKPDVFRLQGRVGIVKKDGTNVTLGTNPSDIRETYMNIRKEKDNAKTYFEYTDRI